MKVNFELHIESIINIEINEIDELGTLHWNITYFWWFFKGWYVAFIVGTQPTYIYKASGEGDRTFSKMPVMEWYLIYVVNLNRGKKLIRDRSKDGRHLSPKLQSSTLIITL